DIDILQIVLARPADNDVLLHDPVIRTLCLSLNPLAGRRKGPFCNPAMPFGKEVEHIGNESLRPCRTFGVKQQ
ncbi:MAG: hypothetical protein P4L57_12290, partial [Rhizomicrobium sp.]|nr:hypothetical protein [Rhizomicrobium sp.]